MKRHMSILGGILVLLAVVVFLIPDPADKGRATGEKQPLFAISQDDIAAFQIHNFLQGLEFKRDNETWLVRSMLNELGKEMLAKDLSAPVSRDSEFAKADPVRVAGLLALLTSIKVGEPVATEEKSARDFNISPNSLHVILFDESGSELGRLYAGKQSSDFISSFVKRGTGPEIYHADENFGPLLLSPHEEWLIEKAPPQGMPEKADKNGKSKKNK